MYTMIMWMKLTIRHCILLHQHYFCWPLSWQITFTLPTSKLSLFHIYHPFPFYCTFSQPSPTSFCTYHLLLCCIIRFRWSIFISLFLLWITNICVNDPLCQPNLIISLVKFLYLDADTTFARLDKQLTYHIYL